MQTALGLVLGAVLLVSSAAAGPVPAGVEDGSLASGRHGESDADRVLTGSIVLPAGQALVANVDLVTHELTLSAVPLDPFVVPTEGHEDDPNCVSSERRAWVQVDQPVNLNGPGPVGETGVPGFTGNCRDWGNMDHGVEALTFVLAERYGGRVDGVDAPTQSFFVLECEGSGLAIGPLAPEPVVLLSCEYRQAGADASRFTEWDSLLQLQGQTVVGSGYGFAYALFE